jgi:outer membrane protein OmpA-like peptidoglycan-associated protein
MKNFLRVVAFALIPAFSQREKEQEQCLQSFLKPSPRAACGRGLGEGIATMLFLCLLATILPAQTRITPQDTSTSPNVLIMGKNYNDEATRPVRELPGYTWLFGFYGMGTWQQHTAQFNSLAIMQPVCCGNDIFGNVQSFGGGLGATVDYRLSKMFQLQTRVNTQLSPTQFSLTKQRGFVDVNGTPVPLFSKHALQTTLINLNIEPALSIRLLDRLFANVGVGLTLPLATQYNYAENIIAPDGTVYRPRTLVNGLPDTSRFRDVAPAESGSSGVLGLSVSAFAGLEFYIPIGRSTFVTPFVRYFYPFTNLAETRIGGALQTDGVNTIPTEARAGSWRVGSLQFGIAYQWGENSVNPVIRRTLYERDTANVIVANGTERLRLTSTNSGVIKSEENGLTVESTIIHESYTRQIPQQSALKALVAVTGIDADGSRQLNPTVVVEEFETETFHPLLPHIFFANDAANLAQSHQVLLATAKAADAWRETTIQNNPVGVHANMLNVIGARLRQFPQARLTVTGYGSNLGAEKENVELSMRRAKAIQTYLTTIWRVKTDRIRLQARTLPEKPSSNDTEDGIAENRRVEIAASVPDILAPVVNRSITRTVSPPTLEIKPTVDAPAGLRSWTLAVKRGASMLQQWTGTNEMTPSERWRLTEDLLGTTEIPLAATLNVSDLDGREARAEASVVVRQMTIRKKRVEQRDDKRLERFSLMLFDFDRAELNSENLGLLSLIKQRIQPNSTITIIGYGDRTGSREYNRDLAERRSVEVKKFLQIPDDRVKILPVGNDFLLHSNETPEGRSYSRIVQVVISTPIVR